MVFSSLPIYLDPPHWQQQTTTHHHHQQQNGSENPQLPPLPPLPQTSSIRPVSMADRARMAKIPQPEVAQKCPRCESSNTKFCYFNNYSLSQPRHFCKTCRRYWTRGGALRNVPVGGGCRRNKKNKSSRSKSPVSTDRQTAGSNSAGAISSGCSTEIIGHNDIPPFVDSLQNLGQYGSGNIGLNFGGLQTRIGETSGSTDHTNLGFHIGNSGSAAMTILPSGVEQWRAPQPPQLQQFPFFGGFETTTTGLFPFQSEASNSSAVGDNHLRSLRLSSRVNDVQAQVKTEENQGLNLSSSRPLFGYSDNGNQYFGGNMWPDLSGLNSSSTNHFL